MLYAVKYFEGQQRPEEWHT